jgi:hypothetical protein
MRGTSLLLLAKPATQGRQLRRLERRPRSLDVLRRDANLWADQQPARTVGRLVAMVTGATIQFLGARKQQGAS